MKIVMLDAKTLGDDLSFLALEAVGELTVYPTTLQAEVSKRICEADVVILNKLKINEEALKLAKNLKLICVTATGYDNIDLEVCKNKGIAVTNVVGYSTNSVAQLNVALVLEAIMHLREYTDFVSSGDYTKSGVANRLTPCFYELSGKRWGIVGMGNIGKRVKAVAEAFGCEVVCTKRKAEEGLTVLPLDELIATSDIITVHLPLSDETRGLISSDILSSIKDGAVFVNVARGAVVDEAALADEVESGRIYAASDVYSVEPFGENHPFYRIKDRNNFILTPHMAWGAYEARIRCIDEIAENIKAFYAGNKRNRVL